MNLYGNYIEESTLFLTPINENDIIEEGVGLDLYKKFSDAKKYYREQKFNLEESLNEGDIKEAKQVIKDTIDYLTKVGKEVKEIDDTEFSSRIGIFGIQVLSFIGNSLGDILVAGGTDVTKNLILNGLIKNADKKMAKKALEKIGKAGISAMSKADIIKSGVFAAAMALMVPLYKEIMKQMKTHERIQYKVNREMRKNHKTEEEAKKAVGGLYKNEILDYLSDIIYDLKRLDSGLKEV